MNTEWEQTGLTAEWLDSMGMLLLCFVPIMPILTLAQHSCHRAIVELP